MEFNRSESPGADIWTIKVTNGYRKLYWSNMCRENVVQEIRKKSNKLNTKYRLQTNFLFTTLLILLLENVMDGYTNFCSDTLLLWWWRWNYDYISHTRVCSNITSNFVCWVSRYVLFTQQLHSLFWLMLTPLC